MGVIISVFAIPYLVNPEYITIIALMVVIPDFDIFAEPLHKFWNSYYLLHKAGSHSYITALFVSAVVAGIFSVLTNINFFIAWITGFLAYSTHVTLDFFATSRVPLFYPISKKEYRLTADRAINPILAAFSGLNLLIYIYGYFNSVSFYFYMNLSNILLTIYLSYFIFRASTRLLIQRRLPEGQFYIPGIQPFVYLVYEHSVSGNTETFSARKKSLLTSRNTILLTSEVVKGSIQQEFYEKTKLLSKEYRFFSKWEAKIPLFKEYGDFIEVVLVLAEALTNNTAYFLKVIFNKNTKEIVEHFEKFDTIKEKKKKK